MRHRPRRAGPGHHRHRYPPERPAMSDIRARRTAVLASAAKAKSKAKADATDRAIRRLVKRGEPITFQSVQREAGVSHAFIYGNHALRSALEQAHGENLELRRELARLGWTGQPQRRDLVASIATSK